MGMDSEGLLRITGVGSGEQKQPSQPMLNEDTAESPLRSVRMKIQITINYYPWDKSSSNITLNTIT